MQVFYIYIAYAGLGAISGVLSGLLGIGGGIITVPCLLLLFPYLGYPDAYLMHMAIATSLAAMIFNTTAATIGHNLRRAVLWSVFKKLLPGLLLGAVSGALIATKLSGKYLEIFFGTFLLLLALQFFFQRPIRKEGHQLPSPLLLNLLSGCIGAISNLLGIGGGSMTVPLLTAFKVKDKNAIGTSAATTLITTICGTVSYLILGRGDVAAKDTIGLINLPAVFIVGVLAFCTAPLGVRLTHEMDPLKVRRIFAVVLALTGLSLII